MSRWGAKVAARWGAVVGVLGVLAVMASGVDASGCAVGSYDDGSGCQSCPSGTTTLAPGAESIEACKCQAGGYSNSITYDFDKSVISTLDEWKNFADTIPGSSYDVDSWDDDGIWKDSGNVGYLQFPIPSYYTSATVTFGNVVDLGGTVSVCVCSSVPSSCSDTGCGSQQDAGSGVSLLTRTVDVVPGQYLRVEETGIAEMKRDIVFVLSGCESCPTGSTTLAAGATGADDCVCQAGGYSSSVTYDFVQGMGTHQPSLATFTNYVVSIGGSSNVDGTPGAHGTPDPAGTYSVFTSGSNVGYIRLPLPSNYQRFKISYRKPSGTSFDANTNGWLKLYMCSTTVNDADGAASCTLLQQAGTGRMEYSDVYTPGQVLHLQEKPDTVFQVDIVIELSGCLSCPTGKTTLSAGATRADDCVCQAGGYPQSRVYPPPTNTDAFQQSGSASKQYDITLSGSSYGNGMYSIEYSSCYQDGTSYCPHHAFAVVNSDPYNDGTWKKSSYDASNYEYKNSGGEKLNGINGQWIKIQLPEKIVLTHISMVALQYDTTYTGRMPQKFKIIARNDDVGDWTEIYHQASDNKPTLSPPPSFSASSSTDNVALAWQFSHDTPLAFNTFALVVMSVRGSEHLGLSELFFQGFPVPGYSCQSCPTGTTTLSANATRADDCVCQAGAYGEPALDFWGEAACQAASNSINYTWAGKNDYAFDGCYCSDKQIKTYATSTNMQAGSCFYGRNWNGNQPPPKDMERGGLPYIFRPTKTNGVYLTKSECEAGTILPSGYTYKSTGSYKIKGCYCYVKNSKYMSTYASECYFGTPDPGSSVPGPLETGGNSYEALFRPIPYEICASCPSTEPYTPPDQGATSAAQCAAVPSGCGVVDVQVSPAPSEEGDVTSSMVKYAVFEANRAKYWRISNAGAITKRPEISEIRLYSDVSCTTEINLGAVVKTSHTAYSGNPLSNAFDGDTSTTYRPSDVIPGNGNDYAAYSIWFVFEFESPNAVPCVQTEGYASITDYGGLGYSDKTNVPSGTDAHAWDGGILLEASSDGLTWVTVAGPDTGSNDVIATGGVEVPFPVDYTVTFPAATKADVLVISGSEYRYVTSLPVSGAYTITVSPTGESSFLGPGSFGVTSGGGSDLLNDGVTSGLIAHWKFDGDGSDSIGGYTLTMSGTTFESPTQFGQAVKFNADTNVVQTVSTIQIKSGTDGLKDASAATDVTFSMWVKRTRSQPAADGNARDFIFSLGLADANYKLIGATFIQGNAIEFFSYGDAGLTTTETFTNTGSWVFLTFSRSSTKARRIYANGVLLTNDVDSTTVDTTGKLFIGRMNHQGAATWFNQASRNIIDDFRVYNRVLTDAEITALYQAGARTAITGTMTSYTKPQVVVQYHAIACPPDALRCAVGSYPSGGVCVSCPTGSTTLTANATRLDDCVCQAASFGLPQKQSLIYDFGTQDYDSAASDNDRLTLFKNYAKTIPGLIGENTYNAYNGNRNGGFASFPNNGAKGNISFPLDTSFSKVTVQLSNEYHSGTSIIEIYVGKPAVLGDAASKRKTVVYHDGIETFEYFFEAGDWLSVVEPIDGILGQDLLITFETKCQSCPTGSTTLTAGATGAEDCACQAGSFGDLGALKVFNPSPTVESSFDGTNSASDKDLGPISLSMTNGFTIVTKFNFDSGDTKMYDQILTLDDSTSQSDIMYLRRYYNHDKLELRICETGTCTASDKRCTLQSSAFTNDDGSTYTSGDDLHVVVRSDGSSMEVKINGVTSNSKSCDNSPTLPFPSRSLSNTYVGKSSFSGHFSGHNGRGLNGNMYGLYIFDRYLDDTEAQSVLESIVAGGADSTEALDLVCASCPTGSTTLTANATRLEDCVCQAGGYALSRIYPPADTNANTAFTSGTHTSATNTYDVSLTGSTYGNGDYKIEYSSCYNLGTGDCPYHVFIHDSRADFNDATWNGHPYDGTGSTYDGTAETLPGSPNAGQWVKIQLPEKIVLTQISMVALLHITDYRDRAPKTFKILARNDDAGNWTEVYHQDSTAALQWESYDGTADIALNYPIPHDAALLFNTFAVVVLSVNGDSAGTLGLGQIALYGFSPYSCQSCPTGSTTLTAGAIGAEDCVCQAGAWAPVTPADAVVAFNPVNEAFGSSRHHAFGELIFNIATNGFTAVVKFNMKSNSIQNHNRIFDFAGKVGTDGSQPDYNIILMRHSSSSNLAFEMHNSQGWSAQCTLVGSAFSYDEWHSVYARYRPSHGVDLTIDDNPTVSDVSDVCKTQNDRTLSTNYIAKSWFTADAQSDVDVAGLYAFNRYLSDAEAEAVLATIKTGALDDPLHTACASCPTGSTTLAANASRLSECVCESGSHLQKYQHYKISNKESTTLRVIIDEIELYENADCTGPIALSDVSFAKSGNAGWASTTTSPNGVFECAVDGNTNGYDTPSTGCGASLTLGCDCSWDSHCDTCAAGEVWVQMTFAAPRQVLCIKSLGTFAWEGSSTADATKGGIHVEGSHDGSTWTTVHKTTDKNIASWDTCASCPSTEPYTPPDQGATSAAQCAAVPSGCGVVDVQFSPAASEEGNVTSGMVKYAVLNVDSTVTFPAATMADVLVISGSHYRYVTSLPVSGAYTITVSPTGESSFLGAGSFGVTSGGGTVIASQTFDFTTKDSLTDWETYAEGAEVGGIFSFDSSQSGYMWADSSTIGYFELPLPATYNSVTITYGSGDWPWGGSYGVVHLCLCSSTGNDCSQPSCVMKETITTDETTSTQTMSYTAGQVLRVEETSLTVAMDMIIVLKNYPSIAITGTPVTYTEPQVVVQYHAIACPPSSGESTFAPTGNVTFLLAKGNVTDTDITTTLQSTIKAVIATALDITEPDRVSIDTVKPSPRRDKEVNMVVHVEHDDTDRDIIAGKTTEVAAAVKDALNEEGLNVCGCNAASLVNQQVQTSITC